MLASITALIHELTGPLGGLDTQLDHQTGHSASAAQKPGTRDAVGIRCKLRQEPEEFRVSRTKGM